MTDEMKAKRERLFSAAKNGYDLVDISGKGEKRE